MWRLVANLFVFPMMLAVFCKLQRFELTWRALINAALFPALMLASVALHEAGHALAARALGLSVPRVEVGRGRRVWRGQLGRTGLLLNAFPTLGLTYVGSDSERGLRAKWWLTIAAGPAASATLLALCMLWPSPLSARDAVLPLEPFARQVAPRALLAFLNLWLLAFNLLPLSLLVRGSGLVNDGTRLLTIPFAPADEAQAMLDMPAVLESTERLERHDHDGARRLLLEALARRPASRHLRNALGTVQLAAGEHAEARATFLELLQDTPPEDSSVWLFRNNLAWADFLLRSDELRTEADAHSAAVAARLEHVPAVLSTRGAVLLWLGRTDEAVTLLEHAFAATSAPPHRATIACNLAVGWVRLGDAAAAARWLARAEENDARCPLLAEARAALAPPRPPDARAA